MDQPLINRVLVATDFSDCATRALDYAGFLAKVYAAPLDILHVTELLPGMGPPTLPPTCISRSRERLPTGSCNSLSTAMQRRGCRRNSGSG
jgi:hypothetical protein